MKLWRPDGAGSALHGGRHTPIGGFASEAGLAALVALRYHPADGAADADENTRAWVATWREEQRSLPAAARSAVLPEAEVVLMNVRHAAATEVPALVTRPFGFAECLHVPPMLARYADTGRA